jgi:hypothetical protein
MLVSGELGRGRVAVWASSFDAKDTNIVALPMFPPLLHELSYWLAGGGARLRNFTSGDTITVELDRSEASSIAVLEFPSGTRVELTPNVSDGRVLLTYGPVDEPGIYKIAIPGGRTIYAAVNTPNDESDIVPARKSALSKAAPTAKLSAAGEMINKVEEETRFDAQMYLLAIAMGLLALETILASIFSRPAGRARARTI